MCFRSTITKVVFLTKKQKWAHLNNINSRPRKYKWDNSEEWPRLPTKISTNFNKSCRRDQMNLRHQQYYERCLYFSLNYHFLGKHSALCFYHKDTWSILVLPTQNLAANCSISCRNETLKADYCRNMECNRKEQTNKHWQNNSENCKKAIQRD